MKILLSGAQCVGKTTLINSLKSVHGDWIYFDEVVRTLAERGLKVSEMGTDETQIEIMKAHIQNLNVKEGSNIAIYDRGVLDCFAYSIWMNKNYKMSPSTYSMSVGDFKQYIHSYDYIFYIAPEFEIQDDGFRSTSKEFQTEIDFIFKNILKDFEIKHTQLSGNIIQRIETLHKTIGVQ